MGKSAKSKAETPKGKPIVKKAATPVTVSCFPRGGVKPLEKQRTVAPNSDNLFGKKRPNDSTSGSKKTTSSKSKKIKTNATSAEDKVVDLVPMLTLKTIKPDMLILGTVMKIWEDRLIISLPNGLTGIVSRTEISDEFHQNQDQTPVLADLFTLGQFVPCCVVEIRLTKKRSDIFLTLRCSAFNAGLKTAGIQNNMTIFGSVHSIEDHGLLINLGIPRISGFVANDQFAAMEKPPQVGQTFYFQVKEVKAETRIVTLVFNSEETVKAITRGDSYKMESLAPGMLMNVKVTTVLKNGVNVRLLNYFQGTVEQRHLSIAAHSTWANYYESLTKGRARIIAVCAKEKMIMLSMAPHIVHMSLPEPLHAIGDKIEGAVIHQISREYGMFLSLTKYPLQEEFSSDAPARTVFDPAFVHISNVSDTHVDRLDKKYKVGDKCECRVVDYAPFDAVETVSMKPSSLSQSIVRFEDLTIGAFVEGKVGGVDSKGLYVNLTPELCGLIPAGHLPQLSLKQLKGKFKVGQGIKARVMQLNAELRKVFLTIKQGFMDTKFTALTSFEDAKPNTVAMGCIVKIFESGLLVSFFGDIKGFVPAAELKKAGVENLSTSYALGQMVKACVVKSDPARQKIKLSLDLTRVMDSEANVDESSNVGDIISCTVSQIQENFIRVKTQSGAMGNIAFEHLTDYPSLLDAAIEKYSNEGVKIERAMILSKRSDGLMTLTLKPALLSPPEGTLLPKTCAEVTVGQRLIGYIDSINDNLGAFVHFLNQTRALIPKKYLADGFVKDPNDVVSRGDTVIGTVLDVDQEKKRLIMSLGNNTTKNDTLYLNGLLNERMLNAEAEFPPLAKYKLGSVHEALVIGTREYGTVVTLCDDDSVNALLPDLLEATEGDVIRIRLLDVDVEKKIFYATSKKSTVKAGEKKRALKFSKETTIEATVLLPRSEYVIVEMKKALGLVQVTNFNCPNASTEDKELSTGDTFKVSISEPASALYNGFYLLTCALADKSKPSTQLRAGLPQYQELKVGDLVECSIRQIKNNAMKLFINVNRSFGAIDSKVAISDVDPHVKEDGSVQHPFDNFKCGQMVKGRVVEIVAKYGDERKETTDESNTICCRVISVSLLKKDIASFASASRLTWSSSELTLGAKLSGVVEATVEKGIKIQFSSCLWGFCHRLDLSNDMDKIQDFTNAFRVGTPVECTVTSVDLSKHQLTVSVREPQTLQIGSILNVMINREHMICKLPSITVDLGLHRSARVVVTDLADMNVWTDLPQETLAGLEHGDIRKGVLVGMAGHQYDVSLQESLIEAAQNGAVDLECKFPAKGDLVQGFITSTSSKGAFVQLNRKYHGKVKLRDLSDEFVRQVEEQFPIGRLVAGRVMHVDSDKKLIDLSLKPSVVSGKAPQVVQFKVGMHVKGTVTNIRDYGVFVKLHGTELSGLCHKSQLLDEPFKNIGDVYSSGDYVKAKILQVKGDRISLGLKPSYFVNDETSSEEESESDEEEEEDEVAEATEVVESSDEEDSEPETEALPVIEQVKEESSSSSSDDETDDEMQVDEPVTAGITWDGFGMTTAKDEDSSSSDEEEEETAENETKKTGTNKLAEEEKIRQREMKLMQGDVPPQVAEDFERLLVASPNSSYLWIKYMSFRVSMTDIDLARDVAERALKTIQFRDEQEKFNVWVAYLNLEHQYGDETTLNQVFQRAVQQNNPKKMYLQLYQIYHDAKEMKKAEMTVETLCKKFKSSKKAWLTGIKWYLEQQQVDKANGVLQKSLKSLEKHKHLPVISKFGQFEYEIGSTDRARTIFEGILSNYPKRLDLWNVYLDKEIKFVQDQDYIRQIFERVTNMKFSAKKIKFLFKKYMEYETEHGTDQTVQHVRDRVQEFIASASS